MPPTVDVAAEEPDGEASVVLSRAEVRRRLGLTDRQIDRRLRTGAWVVERRGLLRPASVPARASLSAVASTAASSVPADIRAAALSAPSRDLVVSHLSAARLLGLPRPMTGWPGIIEFTSTSGSSRRRRGIRIAVVPLPDDQMGLRDGLPVTAPARTVVDCARILPGSDATAIADAALRGGLTTTDELLAVLTLQSGWPGTPRARRVVALASGRRESALESWSAWSFAHTEVPEPAWQVEIRAGDGAWIGRVDAWWEEGLAGEADGRAKYALAAAALRGDDAVYRTLDAERRRERSLRETGADVVRWGAGDVRSEAAAWELAARIRSLLGTARHLDRFVGTAALAVLTPRSR